MKMKAFRVIRRSVLVLLAIAVLVVAIGFIPTRIEGSYEPMELQCLCDSVNFLHFRDGKGIVYKTGHPPGELWGRYEKSPQGGIDVFIFPYSEGENEVLTYRVRPYLFVSRFEDLENGRVQWLRKLRYRGEIRSAIESHEITSFMVLKDRFIEHTFYDKGFNVLRVERTAPKRKDTQQGEGDG